MDGKELGSHGVTVKFCGILNRYLAYATQSISEIQHSDQI
jgi:hypothetical protein